MPGKLCMRHSIVSNKTVIDLILFLLLILVIIFELVITFLNERRYKELCHEYKNKYNTIPAGAISFKYFNFNIAYINIPVEKISYIYLPLCLRRENRIIKKDLYLWHDFINASKFKHWGIIEFSLIIVSAIIFIFLIAHYYLFWLSKIKKLEKKVRDIFAPFFYFYLFSSEQLVYILLSYLYVSRLTATKSYSYKLPACKEMATSHTIFFKTWCTP